MTDESIFKDSVNKDNILKVKEMNEILHTYTKEELLVILKYMQDSHAPDISLDTIQKLLKTKP